MKIDWFTFAAQMVNFVVLVYLLNRFLYGPVSRAMEQREQKIEARLKSADRSQHEAQSAKDHYLELTTKLEHQRTRLIEQARAESESTRQSLLAEARTEVQSRRDDWMQSLHREQETLINLVRQRASRQVIAASRAALTQLAEAELEEQVLVTFFKELDRLPIEQVNRLRLETSAGTPAQLRTAMDITTTWQEKFRKVLVDKLALDQVNFVTVPELVCGAELQLGGNKIGWSIQGYLDSLSDELQGLLAKES